jgi:uncharacterized protein (DUF362 family)
MKGEESRREFLGKAALAAMPPGLIGLSLGRRSRPVEPPGCSPVVVAKAASYRGDLAGAIELGVKACGLEVKGKRILLKPNLVEFSPVAPVNTNVAVVAAVLEAFERLGAEEVRIGEGPGHRRDAMYLAEEADYRHLDEFERRFVDLNRDDVTLTPGFVGWDDIYLPDTALTADLVVSIPKMKTHHWVGATLSMKNLFGLVPGAIYGWPKNHLHYCGISESIVALNRIFRRTFAIVDGIVGMEGDGPILGTAKSAGVLVMGSDLVAVDATCCRIMGLDPERMEYLVRGSAYGHLLTDRIEQRGEAIATVQTNFSLRPEFQHLRSAAFR